MLSDRVGQPPFDWPNAAAHYNGSEYNGSWAAWRAVLGYDASSVVDVEPGFRNASSGDFTMVAGAAAARLIGFEAIDPRILPC